MRELLARSGFSDLASDASTTTNHPSSDTASPGAHFSAGFSGGGGVGRTSTPLHSVVSCGSVQGEVSCLNKPGAPNKGKKDYNKGAVLGDPPLMTSPLYSPPQTSSKATLQSPWRRLKAPAADASPSSLIYCEGDESCQADRNMSSPPLAGDIQATRHGGGGTVAPPTSSPKPSGAAESNLGTSMVLTGVHDAKGETAGCQEGATEPTGEKEYISSLVSETKMIASPGKGGGLGGDCFSTVDIAGASSTRRRGETTPPFLNTPASGSSIEKSEPASNRSSPFFGDKIVTTDFDDRNIHESNVSTPLNKVLKNIRGRNQPTTFGSKCGESLKKERFFGARNFPNLKGGSQLCVRVGSAKVMPNALASTIVSPIQSVSANPQNGGVNPFGQDDADFTEKGGTLAPWLPQPEEMSILSPSDLEKKISDDDIAFSTTSGASLEKARVRREVEDTEVDKGTTEAERTVNVETAGGVTSRVVVEEEAVSRVLATVSGEETIVLPCAPTEKEKVHRVGFIELGRNNQLAPDGSCYVLTNVSQYYPPVWHCCRTYCFIYPYFLLPNSVAFSFFGVLNCFAFAFNHFSCPSLYTSNYLFNFIFVVFG